MGGPGMIDGKPHGETDNFAPCRFQNADGVVFGSAEQYFQWCKCVNDEDRAYILRSGISADVWMAARRVELREDWECVKVQCMLEGNRMKFDQNPDLRDRLTATRGQVSFHASSFFWCKWNGLIMEFLRAEFRQGGDEDSETVARIRGLMDAYEAEERAKLEE